MENNVKEVLAILTEVEAKHTAKLATVLEAGTDLVIKNFTTPYYVLPKAFNDQLISVIMDIWADSAVASELIITNQLRKSLELKATLDQLISNFGDTYGMTRIRSISSTTQNIVVDKVRRGLARGQSADSLVRQILNESPQVSQLRAQTIVANEAHTISQYTSQRLAEQSTRLLIKTWNTSQDLRVRDFGLSGTISQFNHRAMHGQRRPLFDAFSVPTRLGGFELLQFPGDPTGSAGNVINCRCIQTYEEAV